VEEAIKRCRPSRRNGKSVGELARLQKTALRPRPQAPSAWLGCSYGWAPLAKREPSRQEVGQVQSRQASRRSRCADGAAVTRWGSQSIIHTSLVSFLAKFCDLVYRV